MVECSFDLNVAMVAPTTCVLDEWQVCADGTNKDVNGGANAFAWCERMAMYAALARERIEGMVSIQTVRVGSLDVGLLHGA